jgi:hypothetical protein
MSRLKSLREFVFGAPEEKPVRLGKSVAISTEQDVGKTPSPTFTEQIAAFEGSDLIQTAIRNLAAEVVGSGFETEMSEDYTLVINGKTAKQYIDDWNAKNNLDCFLVNCTPEIIAYGNHFATLTAEGGLEMIPLKSIQRILAVAKEIPIYRSYKLQIINSNDRYITEFLHFAYNISSSSQPLGQGVMYALMKTRTTDVPSVLDALERIRKAMLAQMELAGYPDKMFTVAGASDEEIDAITTVITNAKFGAKVVTSREGSKIETINLSRDKGYDILITTLYDILYQCLGDPMLKAVIAGNFSEASIRGITALHKNLIRCYQRIIKRQIEKVWRQVLKDGLYDPDAAQVKLVFNIDIPIEPVPTKEPVPAKEPVKDGSQ